MCHIHLEALQCGYKLLHVSYQLKNHSHEFCSSLCNICRCIIPYYKCILIIFRMTLLSKDACNQGMWTLSKCLLLSNNNILMVYCKACT